MLPRTWAGGNKAVGAFDSHADVPGSRPAVETGSARALAAQETVDAWNINSQRSGRNIEDRALESSGTTL